MQKAQLCLIKQCSNVDILFIQMAEITPNIQKMEKKHPQWTKWGVMYTKTVFTSLTLHGSHPNFMDLNL